MATRARKPKRHVYVLEKKVDRWILTTGTGAVVQGFLFHEKRDSALLVAARFLQNVAETFGQHSELKVRKRNGEFGETRTYPRKSDPRKTKG